MSVALNEDTQTSIFHLTACPQYPVRTRNRAFFLILRARSILFGHATERFFPYYVSIAETSDTLILASGRSACPQHPVRTRNRAVFLILRVRSTLIGHAIEHFSSFCVSIAGASDTFI